MAAAERKDVWGELESAQHSDIPIAQCLELIEQLRQALTLAVPEEGSPVEWLECPRLAVLEDHAGAADPVRRLAVDQVPHHVVRAPCVGTFGSRQPRVGIRSFNRPSQSTVG